MVLETRRLLYGLMLLLTFATVIEAAANSNVTTKEYCAADVNGLAKEIQCECARMKSEDRDSILNYLTFHYCTMASYGGISITLMVIYLLFLFYIIAGTTDNYLVPALTVGVDTLKISPNVAGATILAFANGAPDLFTVLAAFSGEEADDDLGIGSRLVVCGDSFGINNGELSRCSKLGFCSMLLF